MCVCKCSCPQRLEEGIRLGSGVTGKMWVLGMELRSSADQHVFSSAELFCQAQNFFFLKISNNVWLESHWNSLEIMLIIEPVTSRDWKLLIGPTWAHGHP